MPSKDSPYVELASLLAEDCRLQPLTSNLSNPLLSGICSVQDVAHAPCDTLNTEGQWLVVASPDNLSLLARLEQNPSAAALLWPNPTPPKTFIEASLDLNFPALITQIPLTLPELQTTFYRCVRHSTNQQSVWQRLSMTERLSTALLAPNPEHMLLARYNQATGEDLALLDSDLQVRALVGELPIRSISRQLSGSERKPRSMRAGRWSVVALPLSSSNKHAHSSSVRWLVRAVRREAPLNLKDARCDALTALLNAVNEHRTNLLRSQLTSTSELLNLFVRPDANKDKLARSLPGYGFAPQSELRLIVAGEPGDGFRSELHREALAAAQDSGHPFVLGSINGRIGLLTSDSNASHHIAALLPSPVGISGASHSHTDGERPYRQARLAAALAKDSHANRKKPRDREVTKVLTGNMYSYDQCTPLEKAAAELSPRQLDSCARPLDDHLATIKDGKTVALTFVQFGFSTGATAKALQIHPNTVRNRTEEIFGQGRFHAEDLCLWRLWTLLNDQT